MSIVLGPTQYGKAETHMVRIVRDSPTHEIRDLTVSSSLTGDFADAHLTGDQSKVLPTDTQKNMVYAFAKSKGVSSPEAFGLELARHFVDTVEHVSGALIEIDEALWSRAAVEGAPHTHTFTKTGTETRTAFVTVEGRGDARREQVVAGLKDLVILKSTGSEFHDFYTDEYTTLQPTDDRVMATSLVARWRYATTDVDFEAVYPVVKQAMIDQFALVQSLALQQTLWHMGKAALEAVPEIAELTLTAPNKHHFVVDLSPFGLTNDNEVFHADDRPYGLIQATVQRDDAPPAIAPWAFRGVPA